jgi:SOS-response transcriptional repressor LexA
MKDAGILEGDTVLVERTNSPKVGQIVIAEVDNEWTMKFLRQKGGFYYLEPANDAYEDIYPEEEMRIVAVVKTVIRKYD